MIRIHRPGVVPIALQTRGAAATRRLCERFDSGERGFSFDQTIYAAPEVKEALATMQHGKCASCERWFGDENDVEHFRPKAGTRQSSRSPLQTPGYYWLAYEWTNLLMACVFCNQRHKRNLFPLANPAQRALSHQTGIDDESPLFLDPSRDDPSEFIGWRKDMPRAIRNNRRARRTIDELGLKRRRALREHRRDKLIQASRLVKTIRALESKPHDPRRMRIAQEAREELARWLSPRGEYSAMLRANIAMPAPPGEE